MNNAARRREILVFAIMMASATKMVEKREFKATYGGVFRFLDPLDKALAKAVPIERDRNKELTKAQMLVNAVVPINWSMSPDEWKLWFSVQLAYRLVASGWQLPRDELSLAFIQAMYQMAQGLNLANPPGPAWLTKVALAPETLRAQGMY